MRVVSPVAISALAAISTQNLVEGVLQTAFLLLPSSAPPDGEVAANAKALKPLPVKPTTPPEILGLQEFSGVEAPLKLAVHSTLLSLPPIEVSSQPSRPESLPLSAVSAATLPPLDPLINQVIQAELKQLYQNNSAVARGFTPPPERMITAIRASQQSAQMPPPANDFVAHSWDAAGFNAIATLPVPTAPITTSPPEVVPLPAVAQVPEPDIPDYLLPRKAAAMGIDRIAPRTGVQTAAQSLSTPEPSQLETVRPAAIAGHVVPTEPLRLEPPLAQPPNDLVARSWDAAGFSAIEPATNLPDAIAASASQLADLMEQSTAATTTALPPEKSVATVPVAEPQQPEPKRVVPVSVRFAPELSQSIQIAITGEVQYPGSYTLRWNHLSSKLPTLIQALAQAGGLTQAANHQQVTVRRLTDSGTKTIVVNLQASSGIDDRPDLILRRGDTILVPAATLVEAGDTAEVLPDLPAEP
jgi:hypothetical protein